ncbi:hypothetical protein [Mucisphaera sp.]|uniref:hypothetical protein n=1 Tax=Mucisphaera sp. TaxID=2913024 RepID=UPI003D10844D
MLEDTDYTTNPTKLADMIALDPLEGHTWTADDLGKIFKHQLNSPLLLDLSDFDPGSAAHAKGIALKATPPIETFSDLLTHPKPPKELLDLVKAFAKSLMNRRDAALPRELAVTLYYLTIAAALDKNQTRITTLPDNQLKQGLNWSASQPWLNPILKDTLKQATAKI